MSTTGWLDADRDAIATNRILDAAARLFAEQGVAGVGMADIAAAAGCSRATLYRYFDSRTALHRAFVDREARRIASAVAAQVASTRDPVERVVEGIASSLAAVRAEPALAAWFSASQAGAASTLARDSDAVGALVDGFLGDPPDRSAARWLTRIIVSLLTVPGTDADEERDMIRRFVAPVVVSSAAASAR